MSNRLVLAIGADIKNRFLIGGKDEFYHGPAIGDLSIPENYDKFKKEVMQVLKKLKPDIIACDLHPGYFSTRLAKEFNSPPGGGSYLLTVQHHHAHIASVMHEYNIKGPIIGVSFDGTGYGSDGNIWGGEFLLIDEKGFRRLAHLKYRKMPGGDKVTYEPWRMVLSILGDKGADLIKGVGKKEKDIVLSMLKKNINSPLTSSAGRLFDAAAALLGICSKASYEAEGPIKLEALCEDKITYTYANRPPYACEIDTDLIFQGMVKDLRNGKSKNIIATKFHNSISDIIVNAVKRLSRRSKIREIALSGGVFQNRFLTKKVIRDLTSKGFRVYINKDTEVNDLNIALGQYYVSCNACKN